MELVGILLALLLMFIAFKAGRRWGMSLIKDQLDEFGVAYVKFDGKGATIKGEWIENSS